MKLQNSKLKLIFLPIFFFGLFGLAKSSQAAPIVNSVNGTVSDGQSITINGTGFGTKNPAKPYLWADFNTNINPTNLGTKTAWTNIQYTQQTASCGPDGSGCIMEDNPPSGEGIELMVRTNGDFGAGAINTLGQKSYFYRKTKHNFDASTYNLKVLRMWPYDAGPGPDTYLGQHNEMADTEGCNPYCWATGSPTSWPANTDWQTEEILMQANTVLDTHNGILNWYLQKDNSNPALYMDCSGAYYDWTLRCSAANADMVDILPAHAVLANTPNWTSSIHYYMDDVYVDTTWSRVMLCAGSTWANRGHCEIQIPSTWSDNGTSASATVTAEIGTLTGDNYIYVIDSTNTANTDGKKVTIGNGSGDTTPPAAPQGLSVS